MRKRRRTFHGNNRRTKSNFKILNFNLISIACAARRVVLVNPCRKYKLGNCWSDAAWLIYRSSIRYSGTTSLEENPPCLKTHTYTNAYRPRREAVRQRAAVDSNRSLNYRQVRQKQSSRDGDGGRLVELLVPSGRQLSGRRSEGREAVREGLAAAGERLLNLHDCFNFFMTSSFVTL